MSIQPTLPSDRYLMKFTNVASSQFGLFFSELADLISATNTHNDACCLRKLDNVYRILIRPPTAGREPQTPCPFRHSFPRPWQFNNWRSYLMIAWQLLVSFLCTSVLWPGVSIQHVTFACAPLNRSCPPNFPVFSGRNVSLAVVSRQPAAYYQRYEGARMHG